MYGKALFGLVLVVIGAILPYILADDAWLAKLESWVGEKVPAVQPQNDATGVVLPASTAAKPPKGGKVTTAGKVVEYKSVSSVSTELVQPPTAYQRPVTKLAGLQIKPPSNGANIPLPLLLSFGVTQDWIRGNWNRVSTRLGELDLQGWRVPYSGGADDFVGSVTYYFDRRRQVQRIILHGYTSNPGELVQLAESHYRMTRIPDPVKDVYVAVVDGQPLGGMHCAYASVLNDRMAQEQCEVTLELNRQRSEYGMSYEFEQLLGRSQKANEMLTPVTPAPFNNPGASL